MSQPLDKKYLKEEEHEITPEGNKRYTICGMSFVTTKNYAVRKAVGAGVAPGARRAYEGVVHQSYAARGGGALGSAVLARSALHKFSFFFSQVCDRALD